MTAAVLLAMLENLSGISDAVTNMIGVFKKKAITAGATPEQVEAAEARGRAQASFTQASLDRLAEAIDAKKDSGPS